MVTINAQSVANSIMAEAIERWLYNLDNFSDWMGYQPEWTGTLAKGKLVPLTYQPEELVARGQVLPIAEEI